MTETTDPSAPAVPETTPSSAPSVIRQAFEARLKELGQVVTKRALEAFLMRELPEALSNEDVAAVWVPVTNAPLGLPKAWLHLESAKALPAGVTRERYNTELGWVEFVGAYGLHGNGLDVPTLFFNGTKVADLDRMKEKLAQWLLGQRDSSAFCEAALRAMGGCP